MQYNNFNKKAGSKTGYLVDPSSRESIIFTPTVYLVKPRYVNSKSPEYSLVNGQGMHLTSLFPSGIANIYLGDFQNRALCCMLRDLDRIEIFLAEMSPVHFKARLLNGDLNATFAKLRKEKQAA
jgi:hypothetical protein